MKKNRLAKVLLLGKANCFTCVKKTVNIFESRKAFLPGSNIDKSRYVCEITNKKFANDDEALKHVCDKYSNTEYDDRWYDDET